MRILVTRPSPGGERTAEALRQRGHEPVLLPLTKTVPLAENHGRLEASQAGAYAVTSAAALRHWQALGLSPNHLGKPIYAVGSSTADVANKIGFADVRAGHSDGGALGREMAMDFTNGVLVLSPDHPLAYVTGKVRRDQFERVVSDEDIPVELHEIYDTDQISYSTDYIENEVFSDPFDAALLYSSHTASILFDLIATLLPINSLNQCLFLCLSQQIASVIPDGLKGKIRVSAKADEASMLTLVDEIQTRP